MNEEKKLTDEEVLTAIEKCFAFPMKCEGGCPYFNKHGMNLCVENKAFYKDLKRIVTEHAEQKAEIERLKKQLKHLQADMKLEVGIRDKENAELQKQVDELKVYLASEKVCSKQAVKNTAQEALETFICQLVNARLVSTKEDLYDELLEAKDYVLKEKYGVEVE